MGSFWSKLCSCSDCCIRKSKTNKTLESIDKNKANRVETKNVSDNENQIQNKTTNQSNKKVVIDSNSDQISVISHNVGTEEEESQQTLIDEQKLKEELKHLVKGGVKGGDDSYAKVMIRQKSLPLEEYNSLGIIDQNSAEFSLIKNEMNSRRFRLIESMGSGNYADIYKAFSEQHERNVAIKVIDLSQVKRQYGVTFVNRGVDHKLNHKNIIKVYEMIRTDNKLFLVMRLAANGSVADLIAKCGPFTECMSWLIFISILEGLDHFHSKKIAHRNLKLENILLTENFIPKISDFCFALIIDQKSGLKSQIYHSFPYFAPEILQQLPYNPFISDIWSLGVCLYIMANDSLPFKADDEKEVLEKQLIGDWNFKHSVESKLSKQMKTFIRYILEPDISLRPTTKQLIKHEWIQSEPSPQKYFSANDS